MNETEWRLSPIPSLAALREHVLARSESRKPKWRFRLSAREVLAIQPQPVSLLPAIAIERGHKQKLLKFELRGVAVEDGRATAAMLEKLPRDLASRWCMRRFDLVAFDNKEWILIGRGGSWNSGTASPKGAGRGGYEVSASASSPSCRATFSPRSRRSGCSARSVCAAASNSPIPRLWRAELAPSAGDPPRSSCRRSSTRPALPRKPRSRR